MASAAQIAQQLAKYDAGRKSSADIMNEALKSYGVPEIRGNVANLRTTIANTQNALNAVDPSVTGRTSRSLVTEAQRSKIVNNERAPIAEQLTTQGNTLNTESANLTEQQRAAEQLAQGRISDYTTGRQALESQYSMANAREAEARRRAEADRSFNLQKLSADRDYRLASTKASSSGSNKISQGEAESVIRSTFKPGKDGYVNPSQWNSLLKDWNDEGLSTSSFVSAFKQYANPWHFKNQANASKYGSYSGISVKG